MNEIVEFEEKKKLPIGSCFFGNKWSKWETYNVNYKTFTGIKYDEIRQRRYCIKCNKLETRDC